MIKSVLKALLSFFFSSRRRHTRFSRDWSSDVCSSDLSTGTWRRLLVADELREGLHPSGLLGGEHRGVLVVEVLPAPPVDVRGVGVQGRSEERRVGKAGRTRRSTPENRKEAADVVGWDV